MAQKDKTNIRKFRDALALLTKPNDSLSILKSRVYNNSQQESEKIITQYNCSGLKNIAWELPIKKK